MILQPVFGDADAVVRVEVPPEQLDRGVGRARTILVVLALVLFIGCVLVADLLARSLTRPLDAVGAAAERLARGDLDTRVEPEGTHETREIARAMNRLATRIGELLAAEREQVADLSHRLRTPITVLRLDVESLPDAGRPRTARRGRRRAHPSGRRRDPRGPPRRTRGQRCVLRRAGGGRATGWRCGRRSPRTKDGTCSARSPTGRCPPG